MSTGSRCSISQDYLPPGIVRFWALPKNGRSDSFTSQPIGWCPSKGIAAARRPSMARIRIYTVLKRDVGPSKIALLVLADRRKEKVVERRLAAIKAISHMLAVESLNPPLTHASWPSLRAGYAVRHSAWADDRAPAETAHVHDPKGRVPLLPRSAFRPLGSHMPCVFAARSRSTAQ